MADHALLVPVGVEALVVNRTDKYSTIWSLGHKQYGGISNLEPLEPPPFIRGNDWPRVGVTLSWALPDALTRGWETDGRLTFPYIPNRWLIVRTLVARDGNPPPAEDRLKAWLKAWLVESDYLGPEGSNLYPDPHPAAPARAEESVRKSSTSQSSGIVFSKFSIAATVSPAT